MNAHKRSKALEEHLSEIIIVKSMSRASFP